MTPSPTPASRIILQNRAQHFAETEIPCSQKAAQVAAEGEAGRTPGPPKFPRAPRQRVHQGHKRARLGHLRSRRSRGSPATSPRRTLPRTRPRARRPSHLPSLPLPAEGTGRGQCVPPRSLHLSPSGTEAAAKSRR